VVARRTPQSARNNHLLACKFVKYSPFLFFFTGRLSNKPLLNRLLSTPRHLKYLATVLRNLLLIACFLALVSKRIWLKWHNARTTARTLMFHKVVWQHVQGKVRPIIAALVQIYCRIFQWKSFENRLRFDRIMALSLVCSFFDPPCNILKSFVVTIDHMQCRSNIMIEQKNYVPLFSQTNTLATLMNSYGLTSIGRKIVRWSLNVLWQTSALIGSFWVHLSSPKCAINYLLYSWRCRNLSVVCTEASHAFQRPHERTSGICIITVAALLSEFCLRPA